jgi:hypothetical protein
VVDARGLKPPLDPGPNPAILDTAGQKVWPTPQEVRGIPSSLVNDAGISLFFPASKQIPSNQGTVTATFRAVATAAAQNTPNSIFHDDVVVSSQTAKLLAKATRGCRVAFLY